MDEWQEMGCAFIHTRWILVGNRNILGQVSETRRIGKWKYGKTRRELSVSRIDEDRWNSSGYQLRKIFQDHIKAAFTRQNPSATLINAQKF